MYKPGHTFRQFPGVWTLLALVAISSGQIPVSGEPAEEKSKSELRWSKGTHVHIRTGDPEGSYSAKWDLEIGKGGDIRITRDEQLHGMRRTATILLVSGKAMAVNGLRQGEAFETDEVDGPALALQLVEKLLAKAFPQGPASVGSNSAIQVHEKKEKLQINTTSAEGEYLPPWLLSGSAKTLGPNSVGFDLRFTFQSLNAREVSALLSGQWKREPIEPTFPDHLSIKGWKIYFPDPLSESKKGPTASDYGATPGRSFDTLGQLREFLQKSK